MFGRVRASGLIQEEDGTMRLRTLAALLAAVLLAWPASAQEQRGSIEGIVKDTSGAVVPGATVTLTGGSGAKLEAVSDAEGLYRFPSLAPGNYTVSANLQGFGPGKVDNVRVGLGEVKKVDFALSVAGVTESVQVTAESPLVDVKQSARSTNIRAEQVQLLPHGRDFTTLLTQAPGVNNEPKSNGIMVDGASASENRYVVDGIETTELVHGTSGKNVLADFVEEVQIKSSGYTAEFGGSTGGVINVITKSGTNRFNGNALFNWQGSRTTAEPNQTLRLNLTDPTQSEYITYPKDPNDRLEPGGSFGGPIVAGRSWFFGAYQPTFLKTTRTVNPQTSGNAGAIPVSSTEKQRIEYLSANQTAQLGDKIRTRLAYNNSWRKVEGLLPSQNGADLPSTNYSKGTKFPNWTLSGNVDYVVTPKFFVGARLGYFLSDTHDFNVPNEPRFAWAGGSTNVGLPGVPANLQHATGFTSILSNNAIDHDKQTRLMGQIDATWYGRFAGDHQLKGGIQMDRRAEDIVSGELRNRVSVFWDQALSTGVPVTRGTFGYYSVRSNAVDPKKGFITQGDVKTNLVGFFVQDAWTVSNRLTVNAGVRTEQEKVPSFTTAEGVPQYPIEFGFGQKFAPRLGFAYDLKGDGRWKAYGSWGIFYDIFKLELPQGSFGGQKWLEYYYTLDQADWTTLVNGANCPPTCAGTIIRGAPTSSNPIGGINFRLPSVTPGVDIEPDLKPMRSQEASFGLEHQFNNVMAGSVRYVHKQLDRAIEDTGFLTADGSEGYVIANPGEGITQLAFVNPNVNLPTAKRDYDGVEFALEKRFANNWYARATYLWSRLFGNYPGLSQSDENGRADPNVGRLFDFPLMMFKQDGTPSYGPLPTDRPHQVKVQALYSFRFGTTVGVNEYLQGGIPVTRELAVLPPNNYPVQYLGRGSDGRTDPFIRTDLYVQHEIKLGTRAVQLNATVLNLFNTRNAINVFSTVQRGNGITFSEAQFYTSGVNFDQLATAQGVIRDPRFLQNRDFMDPIQARFGIKLIF
jgi:hypothetical protein